ncbi:MAG: LemA family protein [Elusimicrobia bacterium]|nr:LemA family protein [Elusimicrobiota bacterium]
MAGLIAVGIAAFVVLGFAAYAVTVYNGLIIVKNNILKAWGNIDVLLKQRHDEIPKLIKTCEAYMKYEKETLAKIIELRNSAVGAGSVAAKATAEGELTATLHKLFALSENYPDLKAQSSFQQLQGRITDLENQIADRREFYNESVNNFNIRIQSFPDTIVAGMMGLAAQEMFKVSEQDRQDVDININVPS